MRFSEWDPVQDNLLLSLTTIVPSTSQEVVMSDMEAIAIKKTIEKKRDSLLLMF